MDEKESQMAVGILAGDYGTHFAEKSIKPMPMVEIVGRPILRHIMMQYLRRAVFLRKA